jgi:hypothetical protein
LLHLDLNSCKLSELSPSSLSQLPNLQSLDISNNQLHALSPDILRPLLKLNDINLSKNHWQCDAEFERLVCRTYNINKRQSDMICLERNGNKIIYNYHNQSVLCGGPSTASASYTPSTLIQPTPVDVTSETATRTSVNSFHKRTTGSNISSDAITTQNEDSATASASYTPSTIIQPAPDDVSSETATRTSVNSFHERTTGSVISSDAITTQNEDSATASASYTPSTLIQPAPVDVSSETETRASVNSFHERTTGSNISSHARTTQNEDSVTTSASYTFSYEVSARSKATQPARSKNSEEYDKEGDQDNAQGTICVPTAVLVYVSIITIICA